VPDPGETLARLCGLTKRDYVAASTVAALLAGDPRPFRNTGVVIGIATDPAGNRIELIQRPPGRGS